MTGATSFIGKPILDYAVEDNRAIVLENDGTITKISGKTATKTDLNLEYRQGVVLSRIENIRNESVSPIVGDLMVHNYKTMKTNIIDREFKTLFGGNDYKIYSKYCPKSGLMNNFAINIVSGIEHSDDFGYAFKSYGGNIVNNKITRVPLCLFYEKSDGTRNPIDTARVDFDYPDRVTFSNDGEVITIANGARGAILIKDDEVIHMSSFMQNHRDAIVNSAIYAEDGHVYITMRNSGFIVKNTHKDNYNVWTFLMNRFHFYERYLNVQVSNVISTNNGVWFYAIGINDLNSTLNGLFHYRFGTAQLEVVKEIKDDDNGGLLIVNPDKMKLAFTNNLVFVQNERYSMDIYDPETLECVYLNPRTHNGRKIFDVVGYNKYDYVIYACDSVDYYNNNFVNVVYSSERGEMRLDTFSIWHNNLSGDTYPRTRLYKLSEVPFNLESASDTFDINGDVVFAKMTSNRMLSIVSDSTLFGTIERKVPVDDIVTDRTRVKISYYNWKNTVKIELTHLNDHCDEFYVIYNIEYGSCSVHKGGPRKKIEDDFKLLSKAISKSNVMMTEGVIAGENAISDFGSLNVRFNDVEKYTRVTKSFLNINAYDEPTGKFVNRYFDRITGEEVFIKDMVNVPENLQFICPVGIGKDDCKIYIAASAVKYYMIWEYVTNNRDIIKIEIPPIEIARCVGVEEDWHYDTEYTAIDRWVIGEFDNSVLGLQYYGMQEGYPGTPQFFQGRLSKEFISHILSFSPKNNWIFRVIRGESNILGTIPLQFKYFDDSLTTIKLYWEDLGSNYLVIDKTSIENEEELERLGVESDESGVPISTDDGHILGTDVFIAPVDICARYVDIYGRKEYTNNDTKPLPKSIDIINSDYRIDFQDYFYNETNFVQREKCVSVVPKATQTFDLGTYDKYDREVYEGTEPPERVSKVVFQAHFGSGTTIAELEVVSGVAVGEENWPTEEDVRERYRQYTGGQELTGNFVNWIHTGGWDWDGEWISGTNEAWTHDKPIEAKEVWLYCDWDYNQQTEEDVSEWDIAGGDTTIRDGDIGISGGANGTSANPWEIWNLRDLRLFRDLDPTIYHAPNAHWRLMADITVNPELLNGGYLTVGVDDPNLLCWRSLRFQGHFDGNYHIIRGLYCQGLPYLIEPISGDPAASVEYAGVPVGGLMSSWHHRWAFEISCFFSVHGNGTVKRLGITDSAFIGSNKAMNYSSIGPFNANWAHYTGGANGTFNEVFVRRVRCYDYSTKTSGNVHYMGGFVGMGCGSKHYDCYAADVSIGGQMTNSAYGGFSGQVWENNHAVTERCYTVASKSPDHRSTITVNPFIWRTAIGKYNSIYARSDGLDPNSGQANASGLIFYSDAECKNQSSFTGFDFNNVWTIDHNNYPRLRGFGGREM